MKGYGTPLIHLPKTPVLSIASIVWDPTDDNDTVPSTEYRIDDADMGRIYRDQGWQWTVSYGQDITEHPLPGTEERLFRATYACGYKTANQVAAVGDGGLGVTGTRSLPHDLEDACLMLAALRYRWAPRDPAINTESLLDWSAGYSVTHGPGGLVPADVAAVLNPYRRVAFA